MMLKLKFIQNSSTLDITTTGLDTIIFDPEEMLGILDLRSLGYYKITQGILQQNLNKYYKFEKADILCKQFKQIYKYNKERKTRRDKKISVIRSQ